MKSYGLNRSKWIAGSIVICILLMSNIAQADIYTDIKEMQLKRFGELLKERYRFYLRPDFPIVPVDQIFVCGMYYTNTGLVSNHAYIFDFRDDGTLTLSFGLDNGQTVNGNGHYTSWLRNRLTGFDAQVTYVLSGVGTIQLQYDLGNVQKTDALGMIRYFDADGELIENGSVYPVQMFCQAAGHRYNATSSYLRFVCPDQVTASGITENVFEFNPLVPGQAFRQRDFYPLGSGNAIIQRSEVGIYLRTGNDLQIDFTVNPTLRSAGAFNEFSDFNELNAHLVTNGGQLQMVVDEFPPGENVCTQQ